MGGWLSRLLGGGKAEPKPEPEPEPLSMSEAQLDAVRASMARRAIVMDPDQGGAPTEATASVFGRVNLCAPGEAWPTGSDGPMVPLCQINLTDLPFRPAGLDDVAFLTVFVNLEAPFDAANGTDWCLRAYAGIDGLVALPTPALEFAPTPVGLSPRVVEADYATWEDCPVDLPDDVMERYEELFECASGLKLGGWPALIQGPVFGADSAPSAPAFVFQIDTMDEAGWMWGDAGTGFYGRGTAPGQTDVWSFDWQCY